jgi:hypothetical protein
MHGCTVPCTQEKISSKSACPVFLALRNNSQGFCKTKESFSEAVSVALLTLALDFQHHKNASNRARPTMHKQKRAFNLCSQQLKTTQREGTYHATVHSSLVADAWCAWHSMPAFF